MGIQKINLHKDNYAYHVTLESNVASILENGIEPRIGALSQELNDGEGEITPRVYFLKTPLDVDTALSNWLGEAMEEIFGEDCVLSILQVDTLGLSLESDVKFELASDETIHPDRIVGVLDEQMILDVIKHYSREQGQDDLCAPGL